MAQRGGDLPAPTPAFTELANPTAAGDAPSTAAPTVSQPRRDRSRDCLLRVLAGGVLVTLVAVLWAWAAADTPASTATWASADASAAALRYVTVPPAAPSSRPGLLLLLHGSGGDENDLLQVGEALAPRDYLIASLRAPIPFGFGGRGYRWFRGASASPAPEALNGDIAESCDAIFAFIRAAPQELGTDPSRVQLFGFSQGATLTWTAMLSAWDRPRLIRAAAAVSGRLMPDLLTPGAALHTRLAPPAQLAGVRLFASHGSADSITPVAIGRENTVNFAAYMGELGTSALEWHEYADTDHVISTACLADATEFLKQNA